MSTTYEPSARWRFTLHERRFAEVAFPDDSSLVELTRAKSKRLETKLNDFATFTFSIDGRDPEALYIKELRTEVIAWRWDQFDKQERQMFRGIIGPSQDTVSEQAYTVNFTGHDYMAMVDRRMLTGPIDSVFTQVDQDAIAATLVDLAIHSAAGDGRSLQPGSLLPLRVVPSNPDGTPRLVPSGRLRDRAYPGQTWIGEALRNLSAVIDGFDFDVFAHSDVDGTDHLRIFYPRQGIERSDTPLVYGSTVRSFNRSVSPKDYANYWRTIGQSPDTTPGAPQLYAEDFDPAVVNDVTNLVGLWQAGSNASDVKEQTTLDEMAQGDLLESGILIPSYTLTLRAGWFRPGTPAMGDTVPLRIRLGRLDVDATVRIVGINYIIGDDGQEDVEIQVGRPRLALTSLFTESRRDIDALARR